MPMSPHHSVIFPRFIRWSCISLLCCCSSRPCFKSSASFFAKADSLQTVSLACVTLGFIGAWVAGNPVHPHTEELPEKASQVLALHENYAGYTIILAAIATVFSLSGFILRRKRGLQIIIAAAMLAPAYTVSRAGHYGAQLVHLEGVGVQGKFLELNHKH